MKHFYKYLIVLTFLLNGCDGNEPDSVDIGLDFFPLQVGMYHVYSVDSTWYSETTQGPQPVQYQLLAEVTDSFPSPEGGFTYVIKRSKRTGVSSEWKPFQTWSARVNDREAIVNEGNISYVKMKFPLTRRLSWNGNKYNTMEEDEYTVSLLREPMDVGGTIYDSTVTIEHENFVDVIVQMDVRKEIFAAGIGLVSKEILLYNYCQEDHCRNQQIIKSGVNYKQILIEYGVR